MLQAAFTLFDKAENIDSPKKITLYSHTIFSLFET
jgi:hypothetical protein